MTTSSSALSETIQTTRVDFVGSFLRPPALKAAFARHTAGEVGDAELAAAADAAIRDLIARQEAHGLPIVNDGEFRRRQFFESFGVVEALAPWRETRVKVNQHPDQPRVREDGTETRYPITGPLVLLRNAPLDEYRFAASVATKPVKVTVLGPDRLLQRYDDVASRHIYPDIAAFLEAVLQIHREIVGGLSAAGCRYVQIDAPSYTAYVDDDALGKMRARGEDPAALMERAIAADNSIVDAFPDVTFGIHLCRGNSRSQWHRKGAYDGIAERVFSGLHHQRLLLEYDDERSGGFAPLRFVPKGKTVVLGLITSKTGQLESFDELRRRIDEAAQYLPLEQLALSPQCGFASSIPGNMLSEDEQWRKIDLMLRVAEAVWA